MATTGVYAPAVDSLEEIQAQKPVTEVHIDGLVSFAVYYTLYAYIFILNFRHFSN